MAAAGCQGSSTPGYAYTVDVAASGDYYAGGPHMRIFLDDVLLATVVVTASHRHGEWQQFRFSTCMERPAVFLQIEFTNDDASGDLTRDRNLWLDSVQVNGVRLDPRRGRYLRYGQSEMAGQEVLAWSGVLILELR